ncbi:putative ribonuclease H-like domain-containing protein [Tanacetum coccineum]
MNKLLRGNLVRGLPSKLFENDHTCVACQKGKQHKASCKTKLVSSVSQPLQMLHIDLFGPTFVKSLNKKMYCLVVTDDFSRFSWVFFLASKDETSGIFKTFITSIENKINHKVKVIRCDNRTEFKNSEMNQSVDENESERFSVALVSTTNGIIEAKFEEKPYEGFWLISVNSKAFRVFNTRNKKVEKKLHIKFLENKHNVAESGPEWLFDIDSLTKSMIYEPVSAGNQTNDDAGIETNVNAMKTGQEKAFNHEYILLPFLTYNSQGPKSSDDEFVDDAGKKNDAQYPAKYGDKNSHKKDVKDQEEALRKQFDQETKRLVSQGEASITNSTNRLNTVSPSVSAAGQSFDNNDLPTDPLMFDLENSTGIFRGAYDDEDVGAEADLNNLETTMNVSPIPTTRIHKDHPKDQIIRDINSAIQTRRMINFSKNMLRSMIGSLMYLTASRPDIMFAVCACARFQVTPKMSHLHAVKRIFRYLKGQPKLGLWYPRDSPFNLEAFSDSDYAGASLDRKSTTGGCQFLGKRLISWQCKKQTIVANSTTEAEYVAAANCCGQVLWIQNQMLDYGFNFMNTKIYIDNESTICIVKNPVFHSKTKHIEIRHHFIRDSYEKRLIQVIKIHTDHNVADLLTKAFDVSRFNFLVASIGLELKGYLINNGYADLV